MFSKFPMSENNNYNHNKKTYEFTISSQVLIYYHFGDSRETRPTLSYNTPHTHTQTNKQATLQLFTQTKSGKNAVNIG